MQLGKFQPVNLSGGSQAVAQSILKRHETVKGLTELLDESPGDCWKHSDTVSVEVAGAEVSRYPHPQGHQTSYVIEQQLEPGHMVRETFIQPTGADRLEYIRLETLDGVSVRDLTYFANKNGTYTTLAGLQESEAGTRQATEPDILSWSAPDPRLGNFLMVGG